MDSELYWRRRRRGGVRAGLNEAPYAYLEYSRGAAGGIVVFWDNRVLELVDLQKGLFSISCTFKSCEDGFIWTFTGCVAGDFNVILSPEEHSRGRSLNSIMRRFSEVIEDLELKDLPMVGGPFTWTGGANNQSFSRLDCFLVNEGWDSHFGDARQFVLPRPVSDHFPLLMDEGGLRRGPTPFRFENMWLKVEGVKDLLKYWWEEGSFSGSPSFILAEKLKFLKAKLKEWNINTFGRVEYRKNMALEQMEYWDAKEKINRLSLEELEARNEAREEYKKWVLLEEITWRQKSREVWLKEDDRNTGFFHKMANAHRRRNNVDKIKINRAWLTEENDIREGICIGDSFYGRGVFDALLGYNGDKAPGPDGFSMAFWQFAWDFVKADVMCFFKKFYENGKFVKSLNATFMVLIPKKAGAEALGDFRPISLVGSLYKWLAKVLANRLKKVVGKVISKAQGAFVEGRQILDAVLIANEAIDSALKNNESGILCKLDIEKAYDKVDWNFILTVMQKMGLGEKWIRWIKWCISTASFSVLVNGTPTGFFQSSRGLRQGDPLSPYLFVIAMEVFSAFLKRAVEGDFLSGCRVKGRSEEGVLISHLLFADDTLVFCKPSQDQLTYLSWLLMWFEAASGLRINLEKSELIPIGRVENMDDLAWEFGCSLGSLPTTYLGMPLGAPFKSVTVWDGVEERFRRSKSKGGLGVKCLSLLNKALLVKWNWRFANERKALWNQVIRGKYGEDRGGWCSREVREAHGMGLWKGIRMDWKLVSNRLAFIVGNGRRVSFWRDRWCGDSPLSFNDWEVEEAERFLARLQGKRVIEDVEDMVSWTETKSGKFSVKSLYVALEAGGSSLFPSSFIWNVNVQPKISFFAWKATWGKALTLDMVQKRGWALANRCFMCLEKEENINHLLLHCSRRRVLWDLLFTLFGVSWVLPSSVRETLLSWNGFFLGKKRKKA
ncbi:LINE-1 retrotransposable element ORF2 protein [Vitis vinifera]|uniref:LINE-1 retrotransposable element ORF2 protein n=1 Tax=Vitis vinifera TaxID=29760 RepID=A0A438DXD7_VITVI|nr:LINE-1 retrotransposable element ORF2 protein [Vitis vinifera]